MTERCGLKEIDKHGNVWPQDHKCEDCQPCRVCNGKGELDDRPNDCAVNCWYCNGTGVEP